MLGARESRSESTAEPKVRPKTKTDVRELYRPIDVESASLLHGICGRLGHLPKDGSTYVLSVDFSDALDDLVRMISADEGPILVKLGEMQTVGRHLAPMLRVVERRRFGEALFTLLNLLVLLTSAETTANRATPETLLDCRRQYKKVFESKDVLTALLGVALTCVRPQKNTAQDDAELLRKVLTLVRNLLAIPDANCSYTSSHVALASSFGRQERLIAALKDGRLLEFIIVAASSCRDARDGRVFGPHVPLVVEIFQCLLCASDPDAIAAIHGLDADGPQLCETEQSLQKETKLRKPIRHGRFSGSVVVRLSNHFGDNSVAARTVEKRMVFEIAIDIIKSCFNELIRFCHKSEEKEQFSDNLNWNLLSLMAWCLRLVRQLQTKKDPPIEASSVFAAVDVDSMVSFGRCLRRLLSMKQHAMVLACGLFFREAFRFLDFMIHSPNAALATAGKDIETGLFYRHEVISVFRLAIQESKRFSTKMLSVLMETNHVLLKLLKAYCSDKRHIFVAHAKRTNCDSEDAEELHDTEREFLFDVFIADYANEAFVDACTRLLREAKNLDPNTNRFVATMLGRLVKETKMPMLLFRVSVMDTFHGILSNGHSGWRRANADLIKVAASITKAFLAEVQRDPVLIVGAFFNTLSICRTPKKDPTTVMEDVDIAVLPEYWSLDEKIKWLVRTLADAELSSTVTWLCGRLFDAAASRGSKIEDSSVPNFYLHAQTDSLKSAFANPHFCRLLVEAGITRPANEERSWHVSGTMTADEIIQKANLVQTSLRDTISAESVATSSRPSTIMRSEEEESDGSDDSSERVDSSRRVENGDSIKRVETCSKSSDGRMQFKSSDDKMRFKSSDGKMRSKAQDIILQSRSSDDEATLQDDVELVAPQTPAISKWESLKRNNFFLTALPDEEEETVRPKRPPLAIYSEDEE